MSERLCRFVVTEEGYCRCIQAGCGNRLKATEPARCVARCRGRDTWLVPCRQLGALTEETHQCRGCPGSRRVHALFECALHGRCLPLARVAGARCCQTCPDYQAEKNSS